MLLINYSILYAWLVQYDFFGVYSYVSSYLGDVLGLPARIVSAVLSVYGLMNIVGNAIAGRGLSGKPNRLIGVQPVIVWLTPLPFTGMYYIRETDAFLPKVSLNPVLIQNEIHPFCQDSPVVEHIQSKGLAVQGRYPLELPLRHRAPFPFRRRKTLRRQPRIHLRTRLPNRQEMEDLWWCISLCRKQQIQAIWTLRMQHRSDRRWGFGKYPICGVCNSGEYESRHFPHWTCDLLPCGIRGSCHGGKEKLTMTYNDVILWKYSSAVKRVLRIRWNNEKIYR